MSQADKFRKLRGMNFNPPDSIDGVCSNILGIPVRVVDAEEILTVPPLEPEKRPRLKDVEVAEILESGPQLLVVFKGTLRGKEILRIIDPETRNPVYRDLNNYPGVLNTVRDAFYEAYPIE